MLNTINHHNITLIGVDGVGNDFSILKALKYSRQFFPNAQVKFLTSGIHEKLDSNIQHVNIEPLNYDDFSKFCLTKLHEYVDTDYMINCHGDGFVTNPDAWTDDFLNYDYIGAAWPSYNLERSSSRWPLVGEAYKASGNSYFVGNGGFSFRSKRLLQELPLLYKDLYYTIPEDLVISIILRKTLETKGFKFVNDLSVAARFSCEALFVNGYILSPDYSLGFHCGETHPNKVKLLENI